jgi:hypothetical protein
MISEKEYSELAISFRLPVSIIKAIDEVESNGQGFDPDTGKIKIQFEPHWFKELSKLTLGLWSKNKVDIQRKEWEAFNDAYSKNPNKAMESTSVGRMQVMGFHWKRLGFRNVGEMWDFAKKSEKNQLWLGLKFIVTDTMIFKAILARDWKTVAQRYNGKNYWIKKYDFKLANAEKKYL